MNLLNALLLASFAFVAHSTTTTTPTPTTTTTPVPATTTTTKATTTTTTPTTTTTTKATTTTMTMTTTPSETEFVTEMEKCPFSANCTDDEYSDWMGTCLWYKGNFINRFKTMMTEAKNVGCMTPSATMMKFMTKRLTDMMSSPFVKKIPETPCGFCGRKMKCCNKATNFWMQSYASETCDTTGTPCIVEPMTTTDFTYMQEKYPTATITKDVCGYDQMITVAMKKMETLKFFKSFKPLMCQVFGFTRPIVNCTMNDGKCMCCCGGYTWTNGACTKIANFETKFAEWMC